MARFVATALVVLVVVGGVRAIHPPMEAPTPANPGGTGPVVSITSVTPTIIASPEPTGAALALIGVGASGICGFIRRKK
jgi:hypothetical protein